MSEIVPTNQELNQRGRTITDNDIKAAENTRNGIRLIAFVTSLQAFRSDKDVVWFFVVVAALFWIFDFFIGKEIKNARKKQNNEQV